MYIHLLEPVYLNVYFKQKKILNTKQTLYAKEIQILSYQTQYKFA